MEKLGANHEEAPELKFLRERTEPCLPMKRQGLLREVILMLSQRNFLDDQIVANTGSVIRILPEEQANILRTESSSTLRKAQLPKKLDN